MTDARYTIRGVRLGEGLPKLCIPLTGRNADELRRECAALAGKPYDLVEWRADCLASLEEKENALRAVRACLPDAPLLATFRTAGEGGAMPLAEDGYFEMVRWFLRTGRIDAVDIEYFHDPARRDVLREEAQAAGLPVVMSSHDFQKTPPQMEMEARLEAMGAHGCIAKLAVMPRTPSDTAALLAATAAVYERHPGRPLITMSMGPLGAVTRAVGETFGSALTFGSAGRASAPGQFDAALLKQLLETFHNVRSIK